MTDEVAKGVNFVFAKEYILKQYGEEVWQRALAHLPKEQATLWSGALVPFGAYSFPAFKAMAHAVAEESGQRDDHELAKMYEFIADRSLNAVYKIFFKLANPSFVIGNYPKLWSRFLGYSNKAVSISGGRNVQVEELSRKLMPSGHWEVDFEIRWSE
jgi:hypothetical protein